MKQNPTVDEIEIKFIFQCGKSSLYSDVSADSNSA
jgi:hypothetical protein